MSGKYSDAPVWSAEDFAAMGAFMESLNRELAESGELVETRGLDAPVHTRRVQLQNGVTVVTDGPFAETNEVLAGYWVVLEMAGDRVAARRFYEAAAPRATNVPQQRYLRSRAARLTSEA